VAIRYARWISASALSVVGSSASRFAGAFAARPESRQTVSRSFE
jgi:hypothetical protein